MEVETTGAGSMPVCPMEKERGTCAQNEPAESQFSY